MGIEPVLAAAAVRTLPRVASVMPIKPVAPDAKQPRMNARRSWVVGAPAVSGCWTPKEEARLRETKAMQAYAIALLVLADTKERLGGVWPKTSEGIKDAKDVVVGAEAGRAAFLAACRKRGYWSNTCELRAREIARRPRQAMHWEALK